MRTTIFVIRHVAKRIWPVVPVVSMLVTASSCNFGTSAPPPAPPPPAQRPVEVPILPYKLRRDVARETIRSARTIDLCDLIGQRSAHDGQVVRVTGLFLIGPEHTDLTAEGCYYQEPICVWFHRVEEFSPAVVIDRFNDLKSAIGRRVAVVGEFHSGNGRYCHQGSRSAELIVFALESVEGWQGFQR